VKICYIDEPTRSIADVSVGVLDPAWAWIHRINVPAPHRGKGIASKLLREICDDADSENLEVRLVVLPSGDLNFTDLYEWYGRYGFTDVKVRGEMSRLPVARYTEL
jgi:ribosomal protein S18 acetylase RimI-like enzyme